ncbi:MAG: EamA family transporter [Gammaproteobacteria bacterium]|nr:EamA family transporter [Gammaproteobacteria bacterium]
MQLQKGAILSAICAVILMGTVPVTVKYVSASEIEIGVVRLCIAVTGLSLILLLRGYRWKLQSHEWRALILLGLTFAFHWFTYFKSIKLSTASIAAIGVSTFGLHIIILSRVLLKQAIKTIDWFALILAAFGIYLVLPDLNWRSEYFQGLALGVFSGFLYACLPIIHKKAISVPNSVRAWGQFVFALIPFAIFSFGESWVLESRDWYSLAFMGVVATLIAHSLWVKATTELPGRFTSIIYYLYIPVAMSLSILILNEQLSASMISGAVIIIGANVMVLAAHFTAD